MKKLIILCLMAIFTLPAFAQDTIPEAKVPNMVKEAFKKAARKAEKKVWVKKENKNYLVSFKEKGAKSIVEITRSGEILYKEAEFMVEKLNSKIIEHLENEFSKYEIKSAFIRSEGRDRYFKIIICYSMKR